MGSNVDCQRCAKPTVFHVIPAQLPWRSIPTNDCSSVWCTDENFFDFLLQCNTNITLKHHASDAKCFRLLPSGYWKQFLQFSKRYPLPRWKCHSERHHR